MASRPRGFTLAELLVVVGIIAALVALLMPVVAGARRHAQRVQCASNLRQLATAFILYGNDNHGWFPSSGVSINNALPSDWIHWRPVDKFDDSAFARYVGRPVNPSLFRCPADDNWASRKKTLAAPSTGASMQIYPYPYSYCSNRWLSCDQALDTDPRAYFSRNSFGKFSMVKEPSTTSLIGEVDERMMFASAWEPSGGTQQGWIWVQLLSIRHDSPKRREQWKPYFMPAASNPDARGNLAFVDGHVDFTPRRVAHDPRVFAPNLPNLQEYQWAQ